MKKTGNEALESLINTNPNMVSPAALKAALLQVQEREAKKATDEAVLRLERISQKVQNALENVREARKQEKRAMTYLKALSDARDVYHQTGDYDAFHKAEVEAEKAYNYGNR